MDEKEEEEDQDQPSSDESGDEEQAASGTATGSHHRHPHEDPLFKREKRLAMNRESARARRRRKKIRMELMEQRVDGLNQRHDALLQEHQALQARVRHLETELVVANASTTSRAVSGGPVGGRALEPLPPGFLGMGMAGGAGGANNPLLSAREMPFPGGGGGAAAAGGGGMNANLDLRRLMEQEAALASAQQRQPQQQDQAAAMASMRRVGSEGGVPGGSSSLAGFGAGLDLSDPMMRRQFLQMQDLMQNPGRSSGHADMSTAGGMASGMGGRSLLMEEVNRLQMPNPFASLPGAGSAGSGVGAGGRSAASLSQANSLDPMNVSASPHHPITSASQPTCMFIVKHCMAKAQMTCVANLVVNCCFILFL